MVMTMPPVLLGGLPENSTLWASRSERSAVSSMPGGRELTNATVSVPSVYDPVISVSEIVTEATLSWSTSWMNSE